MRVGRKGFYLIEVIIALTLVLIVLIFTAPFIMVTARNYVSAEKVGVSGSVEAIVENKIMNLDYYKVNSGLNDGIKSCEESIEKGVNTISVQENGKTVVYGTYYKVNELEPGIRKRVTVVLCWKDKGKLLKREVIIEKTKW